MEANGTAAQHVEEKPETKPVVHSPKAPLSFLPSSWDDAVRIAKYLSQTGLTPDALRGKEWDLLYVVATGQEFGLSPIQAVREIVIIKGRPYLSALLRIGMVKNSPVCEYFRLVESDATKAVFETKRRGEGVTKLTYTIEQARIAGLAGRKDDRGNLLQDQWNKDPALMLRRRCGSQLADEVYSDVTRGSRDKEDIEEEKELNPAPLRNVGVTMAPPPPPIEAEVVPSASPPKKDRKLRVEEAPTASEAVKAVGGITNSDMDRAEKAGPAPVEEMGAFDQVCARALECQTPEAIDNLTMNTDQTKLSKVERDSLARILRERRASLVKGGK